MLRNHVLLCLFGISAYFVIGTVSRKALIDGKKAEVEQFPYVVSVQSVPRHVKGHICGGGIIDDYFILTAAHCVMRLKGRFNDVPLCVVAGTNDMGKTSEPAVIVDVKKVYTTKEFTPPRIRNGDIAILKLARPLELSRNRQLKALKLPWTQREGEYANLGKSVEIAGWGWQWIGIDGEKATGGLNDTILRYARADIIRHSLCQAYHPERNISKTEFCARAIQPDDYTKIHGACEGDGGGPLVHDLVVVGILSQVAYACSDHNSTGIYTRVSGHLTFIDHVFKNEVTNRMRMIILETE